jgi:hypothetical protein
MDKEAASENHTAGQVAGPGEDDGVFCFMLKKDMKMQINQSSAES